MRTCESCGIRLGNRNKGRLCQACRSISFCHCGARKDWRARECDSCGKSRKAKTQWRSRSVRASMLASLRAAGQRRRVRLGDLGRLKWQARKDGRHWNWYWPEGSNRKATIYRYQWVWIMANGPIPRGMVVHHKNGDPSDDRLSNLELMKSNAHRSLHMTPAHKLAMITANGRTPGGKVYHCARCGKAFHSKQSKPKYCSKACYLQARRSTTSK